MWRAMFDFPFNPERFDLRLGLRLRAEVLIGQGEIIFRIHLTNIEDTMTTAQLDDGLCKPFLSQARSQAGGSPAESVSV